MLEGNVLRAGLHRGRQIARQTCFGGLICALTFAASAIGLSRSAQALPSFARQTGQPCGTCHTDYPGLTPYGRLFKMNGYTTGGGPFRTTLFSSQNDPANALAAYAKKTDPGHGTDSLTGGPSNTSNIWVPPIAMMAVFGYTHTQAPQDDLDPWLKPNDNYTIPQVSLFWGGAVTEHIGAFSQWTYDGHQYWGWDNQDIRYSNTGKLDNVDVIYGVTLDNNPTVGDPWNTVPAWGFPYMGSDVAPDPGVGTLIDGAFAQQTAGVGAYGFFDNLVYLQVSGYRSINPDTLVSLGASPTDAPGFIDGIAPYWRAAIEPHWGRHWLEIGTFGMAARLHPWSDPDLFIKAAQTDHYTDIAFDSQYQYQGDNYWITLRGTYIHEDQSLDATYLLDNTVNPTNTLNTLRVYGSLTYGGDNRIILSGQHFDVWGSANPNFYAGDTSGFVGDISYIPFMNHFAPVWPWANVRLGAKYTYYTKFDGTSVGAHDNNTLFLYAWLAM
jgi:hypothetical protein